MLFFVPYRIALLPRVNSLASGRVCYR